MANVKKEDKKEPTSITLSKSVKDDIDRCMKDCNVNWGRSAFLEMAAKKLIEEMDEAKKDGRFLQFQNALPIPF